MTTSENPRNPSIPPVRVRQGRKSSDEMGEVTFSLLLDNERDAGILQQDLGPKLLKHNLERDFFFVRCDPNNTEAHYNLGTDLKTLGEMQRAVEHLKTAIRLNPHDSRAHSNLGSVYLQLGLLKEAITQYSKAIRINPDDARVQYDLGHAQLLQGHLDQAALDINKDFVEAEHNLGVIFPEKERAGCCRSAVRAYAPVEPELRAGPKGDRFTLSEARRVQQRPRTRRRKRSTHRGLMRTGRFLGHGDEVHCLLHAQMLGNGGVGQFQRRNEFRN